MVSFFRVTLARWAANVHTLLLQGRGPGEQPADDIEAYQPLGLRTRPVVARSTEALVIELPNGERVAFVCDKGLSSTPPEEGETQLHGLKETSAVVRIRASGAIEITAKSGQRVDLQGASQPFVRGDTYADRLATYLDALDTLHTLLTATFEAINVYALAIKPLADPTNAVTPTLVTALTTTWVRGVTTYTSAAAAFRAARTQYLSTRIKGE